MAVAIGASGILGIAPEAVAGTYVAPTKFFPFESESLKWVQDNQERSGIRNTPGLLGIIRGDGHVEGEITFDATVDVVAWFLLASRCTYTKTGTAPAITYVFKPAPVAVPTKTISITVKRGSETSGYVGCVVTGFTISLDGGALKMTVNILGNAEATQTAPTATWPTTVPFGAGMYSLQIPTATQVFDTDKYEFSVEDNGEAQSRIKNTLGAQFIKFGESRATVKAERDFETRTELDQYKNLTAKSITLEAIPLTGTDKLTILTPVAVIDSYEYGLSSVGDLIRASVEYKCVIDATGFAYTITVISGETLP